MLPLFWVCISLLICGSAAEKVEPYLKYGEGGVAMLSCGYILSHEATFCHSKQAYGCLCLSKVGIASAVGCFAQEGLNSSSVFKYYHHYCLEYYVANFTIDDIEEAYSFFLESGKYVSEIEGFNFSVPVTVPIKLNDTIMKTTKDAYKVFLGNYDHSLYYGAGSIGYWCLIAVIGMIGNWTAIIFPGTRDVFNGTFSKKFRKYVTLPALFRRKKNQQQSVGHVFDCLVPTRLELLAVFGFFWTLFALCAAEIYYVKDDPIFPKKETALTRYIADRTGIIATMLTPLLFLFGGRNNFLQYLTRFKFSTMIMIHRWMGRMIVALAFVHSVGYTWLYVSRGYYAEEMKEKFLIWGVVATTCGGLICFQGLLVLRRYWYEVFLVVHILLAAFWTIGVWYHVVELGYGQFMYATFAVWALDRVVRFARLCYFGFPMAELTLLPDDTLKVEVARPKHWLTIPGGHAWLHFVCPQFYQNHPFTFVESVENENHIVFFCKTKTGITKTLHKKLSKLPDQRMSMRVSVDGPYGETSPVSNHSSAVYIAGGSGIPGIYSEAVSMAKKSKDSNRMTKLIWIVREASSVAGFRKELDALKDTGLITTVYITRPEIVLADTESDEKNKEKDSQERTDCASLIEDLPHIDICTGRPNIDRIVDHEIEDAERSVAFITCGHPLLVDDLRYVVVKKIDETEKRLDFYEQLQVWA